MESTFQPKTNVQPIITQAPRIVRARRCVSFDRAPKRANRPQKRKSRPQAAAGALPHETASPPSGGCRQGHSEDSKAAPSGQTGPRNETAALRRLRGATPRRQQCRPTGRLSRGAAGARKRGSPRSGQRRPILPRACPSVLSAMEGLTAGFGMGPGVPPPPWPLTRPGAPANRLSRAGTLAASIARKTSVDP